MKVLSELDVSRQGNDCYIYEKWILAEIFGQRYFLHCSKVNGWAGHELEIRSYDYEYHPDDPDEVKEIFEKLKKLA